MEQVETLVKAVEVLNRYKHGRPHVMEWGVRYGRAVGYRGGHPETSNDDMLSFFEAAAIAEKYLREDAAGTLDSWRDK